MSASVSQLINGTVHDPMEEVSTIAPGAFYRIGV